MLIGFRVPGWVLAVPLAGGFGFGLIVGADQHYALDPAMLNRPGMFTPAQVREQQRETHWRLCTQIAFHNRADLTNDCKQSFPRDFAR